MTAGSQLLESVPNLSEGRRPEVVDELVRAFAEADPGLLVLDRSSDPDHHRTVVTLAGPPSSLLAGAVAGVAAATRLIDLRRHAGVHPRMGALDVLPFIPLRNATLDDAVALARAAAARIWSDVGVPVYLYGAAATRAERRRLAAVRGRGFEELTALLAADPGRRPDVGGPGLHPTAGATAVGARPVLVAFNVELESTELGLARRIARTVRERDGGLPGVQAMGVRLDRRGTVQVSTNLVDLDRTRPWDVYREVGRLAAEAGVALAGGEVVGLVPRAGLTAWEATAMRLSAPAADYHLEERLERALGG